MAQKESYLHINVPNLRQVSKVETNILHLKFFFELLGGIFKHRDASKLTMVVGKLLAISSSYHSCYDYFDLVLI